MASNGSHAPPATGAAILASVQSLHDAVGLLSEQNKLLLATIAHLTDELHKVGLVVRSEQEHTRRVLLYMSRGAPPTEVAELLEKERGA